MNNDLRYIEEANLLIAYAQIITNAPVDLDWLIETANFIDGAGPMLDPTAYRQSTGDFRKVAELARLLKPFQAKAVSLLVEARREDTTEL